MKKNSLADYLACTLFKILGPFIRGLPLNLSFALGRRLGDALYYFDLKHKAVAYANIKRAFAGKLVPSYLASLTRSFYQSFGQSIIEVFLIPIIDRDYIAKNITVEGLEKVLGALKKGKGAVLITVHAGSWELSNIITANLGFPFSMFIREQGLEQLNKLLNSYRKQKGCRIISRHGGVKEVIAALNNNEAVGMTVDQGGNSGVMVDFFGKPASMPRGAIKLALKHNAALIPIFFKRIKGPKIKVWAEEEIVLSRSKNEDDDIKINLEKVTAIFEKLILDNPKEYLWTYKIWKRSQARDVLIISDGKAGHLHQSEAVGKLVRKVLAERNIEARINKAEAVFRNKLSSFLFGIFVFFSGRYSCQGCLFCLKYFLTPDSFRRLSSVSCDIIITAGSSLAGVNLLLSRENLSKSIVIMRPSYFGLKRFSLVIAPSHDRLKKRKNLVITDASINLIDEESLVKSSKTLAANEGLKEGAFYIGILIGGDSKGFKLPLNHVSLVIEELKNLSESLDANLLITTSRRTTGEIEEMIKYKLNGYRRSKLMVIANEDNIPNVVEGILGLSSIVVLSPESISMISEAVNSKKYVFVFKSLGLSTKHKKFLDYLSGKGYIYMAESNELGKRINEVWSRKPSVPSLKDNDLVKEYLYKIL